jgi:hypothetical protein
MVPMRRLRLAALILIGGSASSAAGDAAASMGFERESCESLQREWDNKRSAISVMGDAARERAARNLAMEHRKQVWKYVKGSKRADDIECAWRLALELDDIADSPDELENLQRYLDEFPEGAFRPWAALRMAWNRIEAGTPEEVDREIALFDEQYPLAHLERGHLRVWASGLALDELDVGRAEALLDAAIALPRSEEELEQAKANKGSSWHEWWQEHKDRLDVYRGSFAALGGEDLDGEPFRIGDYRGKVLMLEFWASW